MSGLHSSGGSRPGSFSPTPLIIDGLHCSQVRARRAIRIPLFLRNTCSWTRSLALVDVNSRSIKAAGGRLAPLRSCALQALSRSRPAACINARAWTPAVAILRSPTGSGVTAGSSRLSPSSDCLYAWRGSRCSWRSDRRYIGFARIRIPSGAQVIWAGRYPRDVHNRRLASGQAAEPSAAAWKGGLACCGSWWMRDTRAGVPIHATRISAVKTRIRM